jgi:RNA polymerase sigma-70 factor (ECF subfamily)
MQDKNNITELAKKAMNGDRHAFEVLITARQRNFLISAMSILKNESDAEDAVQEAIIKMYRNISGLKDAKAVKSWMERIVRNESYNIYSKSSSQNQRQTDIDDEDEQVEIVEETREFLPEAYVEDDELNKKLYDTILSLSEAKREAILMYYYDGLSYNEIADVTGKSTKAVSSNLSKAREELKQRLGDIMLRDNELKAIAGIPATSTVMGRAIEVRANKILPDEKLVGFKQKWMSSIKNETVPVKKPFHVTAIIAVAVTAVVFFGLVLGGAYLGGNVSAEATPASEMGREIALVSDDCDCGHINPKSVDIANLVDGDSEATWTISKAGVVVFAGDKASVNAELNKLESEKSDGEYLLQCILQDKNKNEVKIERLFVIGDYEGDAV